MTNDAIYMCLWKKHETNESEFKKTQHFFDVYEIAAWIPIEHQMFDV